MIQKATHTLDCVEKRGMNISDKNILDYSRSEYTGLPNNGFLTPSDSH